MAIGRTGKSTRNRSIAAYYDDAGRNAHEYWKRTTPSLMDADNGAIASLKHFRISTRPWVERALGPTVGRSRDFGGRFSRTEAGNHVVITR